MKKEERKMSNQNLGKNITRLHWKPVNSAKSCSNENCKKLFSLLVRPKNCNWCGKVFCANCISCKRRLNLCAQPDPLGKLYKVCKKCFDHEPQGPGAMRSWTNVFCAFKQNPMLFGSVQNGNNNARVAMANFRDRMNWQKELERLVDGFADSVGNSDWRRTVADLTSYVRTPKWQIASNNALGNLAASCYICHSNFGLTQPKRNCCVCGVCTCSKSSCTNKDLLVYIQDESEATAETGLNVHSTKTDGARVKLAVIKIIGCPAKEPKLSFYLRTCSLCLEKLEDEQVAKYQQKAQERKPIESTTLDALDEHNSGFRKLEDKIVAELDKYYNLIDAMDSVQSTSLPHPATKSNIQILAKAQGDLSDFFAKYRTKIGRLKQEPTDSLYLQKVKQHMLQAKCTFYHENIFVFRKYKYKLQESTPEGVLQLIHTVVNRNAITSCYISVKQVALELLRGHDKYNFGLTFVNELAKLEEVTGEEFKQFVIQQGEEWDVTIAVANDVLKLQLRDHRYFKPSQRRLAVDGDYSARYYRERSGELLQQIDTQLQEKTGDRHFAKTKAALQEQVLLFGCHEVSESMIEHEMFNSYNANQPKESWLLI